MNKIIRSHNFKFLSFFSTLNLIMLYGCSLYLNYISISNFHGIYILSFVFFSITLFNISFGFTTIILGFFSKLFSGDFLSIEKSADSILSKTAILFPIYNEDISPVYSRIKVIYLYLKKLNLLDNIHIYILSDSNDLNKILKEELAFRELETEFEPKGTLNYRRRINNINHKNGNIADFCKRYGGNYDFMIIMDADSFMSISAIQKIIKEMEADSNLGLIQTYPQVLFPKSIYQIFSFIHSTFSAELYVRGSEFWNGGQGPYWGHNAVLRINAFMSYCLLPKLPKLGPLGEKILSHDTIEASLLRNAGYRTKFMFLENSSFEETPPTLLDAFKRDYRWCQGNLQHFWFIFVNQFGTKNRIYILLGIISYFAYFFWFLFLISTFAIYLFERDILFDYMDRYYDNGLKELTLFIIIILFLPRLLSLLNYILFNQKVKFLFILYYFYDTILVIFSSSIYLFLITYFIICTLLGKKIQWTTQIRKVSSSKKQIHFYFYNLSFLGILFFIIIYKLTFSLLLYFSPILLGLTLSIPFSKIYDHISKNSTSFSESNLKEVKLLNYFLKKGTYSYTNLDHLDPLILFLIDPKIYYIHCSFLREKQLLSKKKEESILFLLQNNQGSYSNQWKLRIFNHKFLVEKWRENPPEELLKKSMKQSIYQSYTQRKLFIRTFEKKST
jgi:membrane glycosyltransferase